MQSPDQDQQNSSGLGSMKLSARDFFLFITRQRLNTTVAKKPRVAHQRLISRRWERPTAKVELLTLSKELQSNSFLLADAYYLKLDVIMIPSVPSEQNSRIAISPALFKRGQNIKLMKYFKN